MRRGLARVHGEGEGRRAAVVRVRDLVDELGVVGACEQAVVTGGSQEEARHDDVLRVADRRAGIQVADRVVSEADVAVVLDVVPREVVRDLRGDSQPRALIADRRDRVHRLARIEGSAVPCLHQRHGEVGAAVILVAEPDHAVPALGRGRALLHHPGHAEERVLAAAVREHLGEVAPLRGGTVRRGDECG
jgi:hypothetical protein